MQELEPADGWIRFGPFELDPRSGRLRNGTSEQWLSDQPLALLNALLVRPGEMVAREDLVRRLWPQGTFVDFDHGLNSAISRLREALDDSANVPRFVETIPRRGYRLLVPIEGYSAGSGPVRLETAARTEALPADNASGRLSSLVRDMAREPGEAWPLRSRPVWMGLTATVLLAACLVGVLLWRYSGTPVPRLAHVAIDLPDGWIILNQSPAISPDSRDIVFSALQRRNGRRSLWRRPLGASVAQMLPHIEDARGPFWSPDGRAIGFFGDGKLKVLEVTTGGSPRTVCDVPEDTDSGAWISSDVILFGPDATGGVAQVSIERGVIRSITRPDRAVGDLRHRGPVALPDGRHFVYVAERKEGRVAMLASLDGGPPRPLGVVQSRVLPTSTGHVLFVRDGALLAQRIDVAAARLTGDATVLANGLTAPGSFDGRFSASPDMIVYLNADRLPLAELRFFDRSGKPVGAVGEPAGYTTPRLSPDGTRLAVARAEAPSMNRDIWVFDLARNTRLRLTSDAGDNVAPRWSADARWLMFSSNRRGQRDIYKRLTSGDGSDQLVFESADNKSLNAWSPDGLHAVYDTGTGRSSRSELYLLPLVGDRRPRVLASGPGLLQQADISPDGRLIAYASSESGRFEVLVETFPEKGGRWQISTGGGFGPVWRSDGRELFFVSDSTLMAVNVYRTMMAFAWSVPRPLFKVPNFQRPLNAGPTVSADGQRFVAATATDSVEPQRLTTLLNWTSLVK